VRLRPLATSSNCHTICSALSTKACEPIDERSYNSVQTPSLGTWFSVRLEVSLFYLLVCSSESGRNVMERRRILLS